ncbi:unnamed protein product [Camellia sinensis]
MNYMLAYGSAEASLRQRILFNKVLGDGTRDLTCFWSASGIESGAPSGLVPAHLPTFHASTQGPWHAVIAYDACVRLCLHAWAKQCMEATMFWKMNVLCCETHLGDFFYCAIVCIGPSVAFFYWKYTC